MCRIKNYSSTTTILHHFQAFQTPSPILHLSYIWPRYWTACSVLHGCLTACSVYLTACSMLHGYLAACSMDVCVSVHLHAACWMLHFIFSLLFSFPFFFLLFPSFPFFPPSSSLPACAGRQLRGCIATRATVFVAPC